MAQRRINRYAEMVLACSEEQHYRSEKVVNEHSLVRIVWGELTVIQADHRFTFASGDTLLLPRNQVATLIKQARQGKPYQSVVINLPGRVLGEYYQTNPVGPLQSKSHTLLPLRESPLLDGFFASVLPYLELDRQLPPKLVTIKTLEAIEILRSIDQAVDGILADFSQPGKINLTDFMEKHYRVNVSLETFSRLTGRSLTTFKRDFKKAFQRTPQRWLTQKRLELAHYELSEKKKKPVEVYYEVGFENYSHFSYAFRKQFGYAPTRLVQRWSAAPKNSP